MKLSERQFSKERDIYLTLKMEVKKKYKELFVILVCKEEVCFKFDLQNVCVMHLVNFGESKQFFRCLLSFWTKSWTIC